MHEKSREIITRYLQDIIAAEKNFETTLRSFAKEGRQQEAQGLFRHHADQTRNQWERLTRRLEALGGSTSTAKTFLAHMLGFAPKMAQVGHEDVERSIQDLMIAYAVENAEVGMYEVFARFCADAGDPETERLARDIQQEERLTADLIWNAIPRSVNETYEQLASADVRKAGGA